jgi:hypothetical protein
MVDPHRKKVVPPFGTTLTTCAIVSAGDLTITPPGSGTAVDISGYVLTSAKPDESGQNQIWVFEKLPGNIETGTVITEQGQVGTRTVQRVTPSTTVAGSATTVKADVTPDGAGVSVKEVITVPSVFPAEQRSLQRPSVYPERFIAKRALTQLESTMAGTISTPVLGTSLSASESQVDVFKKRVSRSDRDETSLPALSGQEYEDVLGVVIPYTEEVEAAGTSAGDPNKEITPLSEDDDLVRTVDIATAQAELDGVHIQIPSQEDVSLPDVLESVTVYWDGTRNDGYGVSQPDVKVGVGGGAAVSQTTFTASASASATIDGDVVYQLREGFRGAVPSVVHVFFLPASTATSTAVLSKVGASPWPVFRYKSENLVLFGKHSSLDMDGKIQVISISSIGNWYVRAAATRTGERKGGGVRTKAVPIPAALRSAITVGQVASGPDVVVSTSTGPFFGPGYAIPPTLVPRVTSVASIKRESPSIKQLVSTGSGMEWQDVPSTQVIFDWTAGIWSTDVLTNSVTVEGRLSHSTLPATNYSTFPTGTYLVTSKASPYRFGYIQVTAVTVNIDSTMV